MSNNNYPALNRIGLVKEFGLNVYKSKQEFIDYLEQHDHWISSRTLNRDFEFLRTLGYEVDYHSYERKFMVRDNFAEKDNLLDRALELEYLEGFRDTFSKYYKKYVIDDESRAEGVGMLRTLFKGIDEQLMVSFDYHKFNTHRTTRCVAPLQLKVSQNRWYVIGFDTDKNDLRIFGLDRIKKLKIGKPFMISSIPQHIFDALELQKYYLGVTKRITKDERKRSITLAVSDFLIEYWKVKPIHFTQRITGKKSQGYNLVEFVLVPNIDLVKLIASSLGEVKLVEPKSLKKTIDSFFFTHGF